MQGRLITAEGGPRTRPGGAVQIVNPLEISDWDARVADFPSATVFQTSAWARVLVDTYGFKPVYFTESASDDSRVESGHSRVESDDSKIENRKSKITAVLPLMEVDSRLTGRRGVGLPFTDECQPLAADSATVAHLFEEAAELGRERGWKSLEVRGGHDCFPVAQSSTSFHGHRIDLDAGEEELFLRCEPSARRAVRKAEQAGVIVETSDSADALVSYYALHCQTRRRHGQPPQSLRFFQNIHRHLIAPGLGRILLAKHAGKAIAGGIYFQFGRHALYKFGASDESDQHLRGNDLLFWQAIRTFAQEGFGSLDLGRTSLANEGLRQFKRKWAPLERPVSYLKYAPKERKWLASPDKSSGLHNTAFRILPQSVSRLIGEVLYPHIA